MTDAQYWKRAFMAAARWPYPSLKRDLKAGAVREPAACKTQYVEDFYLIKAAKKRAELEARFPTESVER